LSLAGRTPLLIVVGIIGVLVVYAVILLSSAPGSVTGSVPSSFTVNGKTYVFNYTATTESEREAGLMNRKVTAATTMLFAFPSSGAWTFWMKDTNTSLDIIWISATGSYGRVVFLALGTQPESTNYLTPTASANYVIEAKAGFAANNGISIGTAVQFG